MINICLLGALLILLFAGSITWFVVEDARIKRTYRFPPLVPGLPLASNTFQIPKIGQGPYLRKNWQGLWRDVSASNLNMSKLWDESQWHQVYIKIWTDVLGNLKITSGCQ